MDWEAFASKLGAELARLGVSEREARFLGFNGPSEHLLSELSRLPDGAGALAFYELLGADLNDLQRQEAEWAKPAPNDA